MLSKQRNKKYPTLLQWIGPVLFCTILFLVLKFVTTGMMEEKIFMEDILMTETDWAVLDRRITLLSGFFSCAVLFLILSVKQSRRTKRLIKEKEQVLNRYPFGGDRPSQTPRQTLSPSRVTAAG